MIIYSKLTCDNIFPVYEKVADGINIIKNILIKGGAGVADKKTLLTAPAIATEISDSDYELLKEMPSFKQQVEAGFILVSQKKSDVEKVVKDMTAQEDGSAPDTPAKAKARAKKQ